MYTHAHTGTVHSIPSLGMSVMQGKVMTVDPEMRALGASAIKYDMNRLVLSQAPGEERGGGTAERRGGIYVNWRTVVTYYKHDE